MCRTTNGFEIAEEDLKLRGTGDFLGTRQSGDDENVKLMLKYPQIYEQIKDYIKENEVSKNDSLKL
jgi:ATP-dependent DNA helicase RecG